MRRVYLDNGSTSFPKAPGGQAMCDYIENVGCNVSRGGYRSSYDLAERILDTREKLRDFFGFDRESNVIFTPNVTFSLNYVIHGLLNAGDGLVITSMEHNAVARPAETAKRKGVHLKIAQCDEKGRLDLDQFEEQIRYENESCGHASWIQCLRLFDARCRGRKDLQDRDIFLL